MTTSDPRISDETDGTFGFAAHRGEAWENVSPSDRINVEHYYDGRLAIAYFFDLESGECAGNMNYPRREDFALIKSVVAILVYQCDMREASYVGGSDQGYQRDGKCH